MSENSAVHPEDILADGAETTSIKGKIVRKGTVAAFLANVEILESNNASECQKQEALNVIKELAPAIITIGLHNYVTFKHPQVTQILMEAEKFN